MFSFQGKYSHLRGTHLKTSTSLFYVNAVVLPVLTSLFDHLANCEYGSDLLRKLKLKMTVLVDICLYNNKVLRYYIKNF